MVKTHHVGNEKYLAGFWISEAFDLQSRSGGSGSPS
jgi:hypothetical protein